MIEQAHQRVGIVHARLAHLKVATPMDRQNAYRYLDSTKQLLADVIKQARVWESAMALSRKRAIEVPNWPIMPVTPMAHVAGLRYTTNRVKRYFSADTQHFMNALGSRYANLIRIH